MELLDLFTHFFAWGTYNEFFAHDSYRTIRILFITVSMIVYFESLVYSRPKSLTSWIVMIVLPFLTTALVSGLLYLLYKHRLKLAEAEKKAKEENSTADSDSFIDSEKIDYAELSERYPSINKLDYDRFSFDEDEDIVCYYDSCGELSHIYDCYGEKIYTGYGDDYSDYTEEVEFEGEDIVEDYVSLEYDRYDERINYYDENRFIIYYYDIENQEKVRVEDNEEYDQNRDIEELIITTPK